MPAFLKTLSPLLGAVIVALAMSACGSESPSEADNSTSEAAAAPQVLTVAYANEEPYGYQASDGTVTGEAPEIIKVVADRLGYDEVQFVQTDWQGLIPGLAAKRFDVVAAGMYITPERAANVAFSMPTYRIGEAMLVLAGNPKGIDGYETIAGDDSLTLGVVQGTVEVGYAEAAGIPSERVKVFNDNAGALAGVRAQQVDAFAGTALTVQVMVDKLGADADVERASPFIQPTDENGREVYGYGAFAFNPENTELRDAFNEVLSDFLGSPEHTALVAPFGFSTAEMTNGMTVADVLALSDDAGE